MHKKFKALSFTFLIITSHQFHGMRHAPTLLRSATKQMLHAIHKNRPERAVEIIRESTVDPNATYRGDTALFFAAGKRYYNVVRALLERGADPNRPSECGLHLPLINALFSRTSDGSAKRSNKAIVRDLISHGADISLADTFKRTPLLWAVAGRDADVALHLINSPVVNYGDGKGICPLHVAVSGTWRNRKGQLRLIERLLDSLADRNVQDRRGKTPLHWAFEGARGCTPDGLEHIQLLLNGTDLIDLAIADNEGKTPLDYLCDWSNDEKRVFLECLLR